MSTQPEPESGYARDRDGVVWVKAHTHQWKNSAGGVCSTSGDVSPWNHIELYYGPMTPLLPAERPDDVPEDAVPFVGWVVRIGSDRVQALAPNGERWSNAMSDDLARVYDFPVPPKPEPTLAEKARERAVAVLQMQPEAPGHRTHMLREDAQLLIDLANELEGR